MPHQILILLVSLPLAPAKDADESVAGIHMGESANRFVTVEHPLMMVIGVALITIGKIKAKKIEDVAKAIEKFKKINRCCCSRCHRQRRSPVNSTGLVHKSKTSVLRKGLTLENYSD